MADNIFISILLFTRNNSPHPTFRIGHITLVSRDKVHVAVEDTLAGSLANIDANVKSIGMITLFNLLTHILKHHVYRFALVIGEIKIRGNMTLGNNEGMTW